MNVLLLLGCGGGLPAGDPSHPDVVFVTIDSLRADHLGAAGNPRAPSPWLDALAASGTRYTQARASSPWTLPSHVTLLSGEWPTDHGVVDDDVRIPDDLPWLPATLHDTGWVTGGFVSSIYTSRTFGFARGFDQFDDFGVTLKDNLEHPVRAERVLAAAREWATTVEPGRPIFLWLHLYDVHYPYLPPEPWNTRYDAAGTRKSTAYTSYFKYLTTPIPLARMQHLDAQYDECIAYVDDQLRAFATTWTRPVTFVVTADHGEELGERGSWGHGHTLHPEVLRVPLIVGDGRGRVDDAPIGTVDVAGLVAGLTGAPWKLRPRGGPQLAETSRFDTAKLGLWVDGRRLDVDLGKGTRALYADPAEATVVAAGDAALEAQLWSLLPERWTATGPVTTTGWTYHAGALGPVGGGTFGVYPADATVDGARSSRPELPVTLGDDTRAALRALGYEE